MMISSYIQVVQHTKQVHVQTVQPFLDRLQLVMSIRTIEKSRFRFEYLTAIDADSFVFFVFDAI